MKKLYLHKLYTPRDMAKILQRKEEEIINLLERERTKGILGRKMLGYWYIRGKQVIEIQKLLKGDRKNVGSTNNGFTQEEKEETKKRSKKTQ